MKKRTLRTLQVLALSTALTAGFISPASAAESDFDTTFDTDGMVAVNFNNATEVSNQAVAIQSDGKIVAAGDRFFDFKRDMVLTRYNPNGSLDLSFGNNGIVISELEAAQSGAEAVAIQANGKIVIAGYSSNGSNLDFALLRFNSNGGIDPTFGNNGLVLTDFNAGNDGAYAIEIQNDKKIVVSGGSTNGGVSSFAVARFNEDGALDNSFGEDENGKVQTDFEVNGAIAYASDLQSNGKIVVVGVTSNSYNGDVVVVRYNSDGSLDLTFNSTGYVRFDSEGSEIGLDIALQNDGKIIITGAIALGVPANFLLIRLNSNGSFDTSFGTSGVKVTSIESDEDVALAVAVQNDGKIIAAGYSVSETPDVDDLVIARFTSTGELDETFGENGKLIFHPIGATMQAKSIALQSDGKIVVAGGVNSESIGSLLLMRFMGSYSEKKNDGGAAAAAAAAAQRQRELTEILSLVPSIAGLSTNISELTNSLLFKQKCVKGKKAKYVKYGAKCPKGYTKKK
jgi:uncharacterized delta-60 repeat protein